MELFCSRLKGSVSDAHYDAEEGTARQCQRRYDVPATPSASSYSVFTPCISFSNSSSSASSAAFTAEGSTEDEEEEGRDWMRYSSCLALRRKSETSSCWLAAQANGV